MVHGLHGVALPAVLREHEVLLHELHDRGLGLRALQPVVEVGLAILGAHLENKSVVTQA